MRIAESRARRRAATVRYRRRRLVTAGLGLAAAVALAVGLAVGSGDGGGDSLTPAQAVKVQRAAEPVPFTVSVSGDLLIHSPVWERALALGGGDYDFAPELAKLKPYVAGADLGICHVETPITHEPPRSYPIFNA